MGVLGHKSETFAKFVRIRTTSTTREGSSFHACSLKVDLKIDALIFIVAELN